MPSAWNGPARACIEHSLPEHSAVEVLRSCQDSLDPELFIALQSLLDQCDYYRRGCGLPSLGYEYILSAQQHALSLVVASRARLMPVMARTTRAQTEAVQNALDAYELTNEALEDTSPSILLCERLRLADELVDRAAEVEAAIETALSQLREDAWQGPHLPNSSRSAIELYIAQSTNASSSVETGTPSGGTISGHAVLPSDPNILEDTRALRNAAEVSDWIWANVRRGAGSFDSALAAVSFVHGPGDMAPRLFACLTQEPGAMEEKTEDYEPTGQEPLELVPSKAAFDGLGLSTSDGEISAASNLDLTHSRRREGTPSSQASQLSVLKGVECTELPNLAGFAPSNSSSRQPSVANPLPQAQTQTGVLIPPIPRAKAKASGPVSRTKQMLMLVPLRLRQLARGTHLVR